jgi:hypothetical protein
LIETDEINAVAAACANTVDACATLTDAEHGGTLSAMHTYFVFCDVRDTQSMLGLIAAA